MNIGVEFLQHKKFTVFSAQSARFNVYGDDCAAVTTSL